MLFGACQSSHVVRCATTVMLPAMLHHVASGLPLVSCSSGFADSAVALRFADVSGQENPKNLGVHAMFVVLCSACAELL
jgi:hypothetical protein